MRYVALLMLLLFVTPTVLDLVDLKNYGIICNYVYDSTDHETISCELSIEDAISLMQYLHQLENSAIIET